MKTTATPAWLDVRAMLPEGLREETLALVEEIRALTPAVEDLCKRAYVLSFPHNDAAVAISAELSAACDVMGARHFPQVEGFDLAMSLGGFWYLLDALGDMQSHLVAAMDDSVTPITADWYDEIKAQYAPAPCFIETAEAAEPERAAS